MSGCKMPCFKRNWFRVDLREMARSCSKLQQVGKLRKYAENSTIKVFYWGWLRVPAKITILYRKLKISEIQMIKQNGVVRLGFNCGIPYEFSFVFSIEPRYCKDMKNMLK